jgi:hypothetical protein
MTGALLLRFEMFGAGVSIKWRPFVSSEHGDLCRAAGLDPVSHYFDVPESFHRVGNGTARMNGRSIGGFVMRAGITHPVGKVSIAYESERFRDDDPTNRHDFERL